MRNWRLRHHSAPAALAQQRSIGAMCVLTHAFCCAFLHRASSILRPPRHRTAPPLHCLFSALPRCTASAVLHCLLGAPCCLPPVLSHAHFALTAGPAACTCSHLCHCFTALPILGLLPHLTTPPPALSFLRTAAPALAHLATLTFLPGPPCHCCPLPAPYPLHCTPPACCHPPTTSCTYLPPVSWNSQRFAFTTFTHLHTCCLLPLPHLRRHTPLPHLPATHLTALPYILHYVCCCCCWIHWTIVIC